MDQIRTLKKLKPQGYSPVLHDDVLTKDWRHTHQWSHKITVELKIPITQGHGYPPSIVQHVLHVLVMMSVTTNLPPCESHEIQHLQ